MGKPGPNLGSHPQHLKNFNGFLLIVGSDIFKQVLVTNFYALIFHFEVKTMKCCLDSGVERDIWPILKPK